MTGELGPLKFIVAGFEHSGTTMLSEIFRQASYLDSGFEGGFLLTGKPSDFVGCLPFYKNLKGGWGLTQSELDYICVSANWGVAYQRLMERSSKLAGDTLAIFDKTPRYLQSIDKILNKYKSLKSVILVRDFRSLMYSTYKRSGLKLGKWKKHSYPHSVHFLNTYIDAHERLVKSHNGKRAYLVKYEDLCFNTKAVCEKVFEFLDLEFYDSYLNFPGPKFNNVYGQRVDEQYVFQFHKTFNNRFQARIAADFDRREDWFYTEPHT